MTFQMQAFRHDPANGIFGDCYRTVLSCIIGVNRDELPHEQRQLTDLEFTRLYDDWLHSRGYRRIFVSVSADSIEAALQWASYAGDGLPYVFSGTSRTGVNHAVLARDAEIIHDPSLTDAGIVGPCNDGLFWIEWIVSPAAGRKGDRPSASRALVEGQAALPEGQPPAGGEAAREAP